MKRKVKVYLDTSVISALFDERNPERKSLTEAFFKEIENYLLFISELAAREIERAPDIALRGKMKEIVSQFSVLSLSTDIELLANEYIRYGALPNDYPEDAYHIAAAVVGDGHSLKLEF